MTDPADRYLEERGCTRWPAGSACPLVPTEDDVRRGRRRLLRMRVAMAGATTAALAVVLGVTSLTAGDPKATEPPLVTQPPSTLPATPNSSPTADGGADEEPGGGQPGNTGRNQDAVDLAGDPGSQHTDDGVPAKSSTNGTNGTATGGTTTHDGTSTGPHDDPTGTYGSDPTEVPSSNPTETPSSTPTETPTSTPTTTPTSTPTPTPTVPPTQTPKVRVHQVLRYYNDVLAEHLDPRRLHLQPYSRKIDSKEATTLDGRLFALGSTYRWEDGRSRSGLQLTVASGWDQVEWLCGASLRRLGLPPRHREHGDVGRRGVRGGRHPRRRAAGRGRARQRTGGGDHRRPDVRPAVAQRRRRHEQRGRPGRRSLRRPADPARGRARRAAPDRPRHVRRRRDGGTGEAPARPSRRPGSAGRPGCAATGAWVASRAARWRGLWSRSTARAGSPA